MALVDWARRPSEAVTVAVANGAEPTVVATATGMSKDTLFRRMVKTYFGLPKKISFCQKNKFGGNLAL